MFKRIGNLIKGFFGLFVGGLEKRNPKALLEVEKENLRKQISRFNQGLASHAGLVEQLISRVKKLDKEENDLRAKTAANLKSGNRQLAGQYALQLKKVDAEHDEVKVQLENSETQYKELIKARDISVKEARVKIEEISRGIDDAQVQKAAAELNEMASGMITSIGGSGDTLTRLEEIVEEERTKAAGRSRVARDSMDISEINMKESEQEALQDMALAEFAAEQGIAIDSEDSVATPAAEPEKDEETPSSGSMGPGVTQ
ncbi:MAG: phage shock protein A [Cryomorphaceae bacterium]|jgi:phage shock protein A